MAQKSGGVQAAASHRLTVPRVTRAIASLGDRAGARYTDISKALKENGGDQPTFFQLKAVLTKACKEGTVRQNSQGRWMLPMQEGTRTWGRVPAPAKSSHLHRRRRRRRGGRGKGRRKGRRKGRKKRRRRRKRSRSKGRGRKGKGKKGRGKKGRRKKRKGGR